MNTASYPKKSKTGNALVIVVILVLFLLAAIFLYSKQSRFVAEALPTLPPVEARTNPEPTSGFTISVGIVDPGNKVTADEVSVSQPSYLYVIRNDSKEAVIGKSALLQTGDTKNVEILLSSSVKDGDVVFIRLVDQNGKAITNDSKQIVQVQKNVGHLMTHYASEY